MRVRDDQHILYGSFEELAPSAEFVYKTLEQNGSLTPSELADQTRLAPRTIRDAVVRLEDRDLIKQGYCPSDALKRVYSLKTD